LRAKRMAIGDNYYNPSSYCWEGSCTTSIDDNADLVVEGKVGIGVLKPEKELHVAGDTKIENDLNVEGGVVIGNPEGGNKGAGTINAEKIYVNGSEFIGGLEYRGSCHPVEYYYWSSAHGVTINKTPTQACQDAGYTYTGDNGVCLVSDTGDHTGTRYVLSKCNLDCGCWDTGYVRSCVVYCCE